MSTAHHPCVPGLLALLEVLWVGSCPAQVSLQRELVQLVDLVDPGERAAAASRLADREEIALSELLAAMVGFGSFGEQASGTSRVTVPLWTGDGTEQAELHLYVPEAYASNRPSPLLLIGHGTGGDGSRALSRWIRIAEQEGMLLVAPTDRDAEQGWAFSLRERQLALSALRYARRRFNVDENRIYCAGVSRGGHMAWDLALRHPDRFAAIVPMIGGPRIVRANGQNNLRYLENIAHLPILDLQGAKDDKYLVANVRLAFRKLAALGSTQAELIEFPELKHAFDMSEVDWREFFGAHTRDGIPGRVVRLAAEPGEAGSFWVEITESDPARVKIVPNIPSTRRFESMDEMDQREYVSDEVEKRTARLAVTMLAPGQFVAEARHVRRFRLLLTPEMYEEGKSARVRYKGRQRSVRVRRDKNVLLQHFVERFDRTFLPVAEVRVR